MHFYANGVPFFQAQCLFFGGMVSAVKICIGGGNLDLMKSWELMFWTSKWFDPIPEPWKKKGLPSHKRRWTLISVLAYHLREVMLLKVVDAGDLKHEYIVRITQGGDII